MPHIIFKCKNRPFEICHVVYVLLLTAMTLVTPGKYVSAVQIPHCSSQYTNNITCSWPFNNYHSHHFYNDDSNIISVSTKLLV